MTHHHDEADYPCSICGQLPDTCICPECPVCGEIGFTGCYTQHGLTRSAEQIELHRQYHNQQALLADSEETYRQWLQALENDQCASLHAHELANH